MSDLPTSADTYRRLTGVDPLAGKRIGTEYAVPCLNRGVHTHGDKSPSLHVSALGKGWTCRVCGVGGGAIEMVKFAGHAKTDAEALSWLGVEKDAPAPRPERRLVATYAYHHADATTAYEVLRYDPKDFRQRRRDSAGRDVWNLDGVTRVPYHLPEVLAAIVDHRTVIVCEGEKDADNLAAIGFVATTNAGGAAIEWTADFVRPLVGAKRIVVVADNDDAGRNAARKRAYVLREICGDVRLIEHLPVSLKGDVSDLIAQGWDKARLAQLFEAADPIRGDVEKLADVVRRQKAAPPPPAPIATGFKCIDEAMGGLRRGQTSVFAGRPGGGKSAFGEQLAAYVAEKHRVLYCSLEMGTDRSVDRTVSRMTSMHESQYLRLNRPVNPDSLDALDLHFTEYAALSDIAASVLKLRPDFVIIDHARELDGWFKVERGSRADITAAVIMGQIVRLGKTSGAHMCLLSQCTRSTDNKRPSLSDLRDCLPGLALVTNADTGDRISVQEIVERGLRFNVWSLNDRLKLVRRPISDAWAVGLRPVYAVTSKTGHAIRCSGGHRFLTTSGWSEIRNLGVGSSVALPRHLGTSLDITWDEIESIEIVGGEPCYDITVDDTHTFCVDDFVTHNSGAVEEQADNVFFIHRPFQYNLKEADNNAELVCWKSRGKGGYIGHLRWLGETMVFDDPPASDMWIYARCCGSDERAKMHGVA